MARVRLIRRAAQQLARRKRASVLLVVGFIMAVNGWVMADTADALRSSPIAMQVYSAHRDVMSLESWGAVFIIVGSVSAVAGFVNRLPAWFGFAALQLLSTFWGLLFIASYFQSGYTRALVGMTQWAMVTALLAIIANWEDPPPPRSDALQRVLDEGR